MLLGALHSAARRTSSWFALPAHQVQVRLEEIGELVVLGTLGVP